MFRIDKNSVRRGGEGETYVILRPPVDMPQEPEFDFTQNPEPVKELTPEEQEAAEKEAAEAVEKANNEAAGIIERAKIEASSLIAEANMQSESIKQQAYSEGYAAGEADGRNISAQTLKSEVDRLGVIARELSQFKDKLLTEAERDLLDLSLDIAERIIRIELLRDDVAYMSLVKEALSKVKSKGKVLIRVTERDYYLYFEGMNRNLSAGTDGTAVEVVPDSELPPDSIIIESQSETIDASPWRQMGAIGNALMDAAGLGGTFSE